MSSEQGIERRFKEALAAYASGNYERALVLYEQCLALAPTHVSAHFNHAGTLMALKRHREAVPLLRRLAHEHRQEPLVWQALMEALRATEQWPELAEVAAAMLDANPENHVALNYLGWAQLKQGDPDSVASNLFYRAIEGDERYYSAWLGLGWDALFSRETEEAIGAFESAVILAVPEIVPDHGGARFEALYGLGLAYLEAGMSREALDVANRMNADNRVPAKTATVRARAYIRSGMAEAGLAEGEFAVSLGSDNPYLLLDMAFEYARIGDETNALRLLAGVDKDVAPGTLDNYELRFGRTSVLLALKRYDQCIEETKELLRDFGEDENLLNALGVQYLHRGKQGDKLHARRYFDKAMGYSRDDLTLSNRATILAQAGAVKEALEMTREALEVAKTTPRTPLSIWSLPMNIARYATELGDVAQAKKVLNELIGDEGAPDWAVARARQRLEEIERGDAGRTLGGLPPVDGTLHARIVARNRRLTVDLYERKVCDECRKALGWRSCEAAYHVPGLKEIGDLDVYGFTVEEGGAEVVCVGECKLRFESQAPVTHEEMNQLVDKKLRPLRAFMNRAGDTRPLRGFFFANADYDEDARRLARSAGVRIFEVKLPKDWQYRDDWSVRLEESAR